MFQPRPQEKLSRLYLFYGASKTLAVLHGRSKKQTNVYCLWNHTSKFCLICQKCFGNTFFPHLFKDHNLDCLSRSFPLKSWRKIFLSLQETTNGTDGKKLFILKAHSELSLTLSFTPQLRTKGFKLSSANPTATSAGNPGVAEVTLCSTVSSLPRSSLSWAGTGMQYLA